MNHLTRKALQAWFDSGNSALLVPGWQDSGPEHWQSHWQRAFPALARVQQDDWQHPNAATWTQRLNQSVAALPGRVLLIGHSLGCLTITHWSHIYRQQSQRIHAALLVAPADSERQNVPWQGVGFRPMPIVRLPFPSLLIASDNDYACSVDAAERMTRHWGSQLHLINQAGHINADSELGDWAQGQAWLRQLLKLRVMALAA